MTAFDVIQAHLNSSPVDVSFFALLHTRGALAGAVLCCPPSPQRRGSAAEEDLPSPPKCSLHFAVKAAH